MNKTLSKTIKLAINALFERAKARFLGSSYDGPRIYVQVIDEARPEDTLEGAFRHALFMNLGARAKVNDKLLDAQEEELDSVIDALKEKTKLDVLRAVQEGSEKKVMEAMDRAEKHMELIASTEVRRSQSLAETDSVSQFASSAGIADPTIFFVTVRDKSFCKICRKMYLSEDNSMIPKVFKLSELAPGYLKLKEWDGVTPYRSGHPRCRCSITVLAPGFTFNGSGRVVWKDLDWDEYEERKKLK